MRRILVSGGGGFIGSHLVTRLKAEGFWVRVADLKYPEFSPSPADDFRIGDLRDPQFTRDVVDGIDEVYQLAADMGGAGYVFTGDHDACIMDNSAMINLNVLEFGRQAGVRKFFVLHQPASTRNSISATPTTRSVVRTARIQRPPTVNTDGRSSLANASISLTCAITALKFMLPLP